METGALPSLEKERLEHLKQQQDCNPVFDWNTCSPATHSMDTTSGMIEGKISSFYLPVVLKEVAVVSGTVFVLLS